MMGTLDAVVFWIECDDMDETFEYDGMSEYGVVESGMYLQGPMVSSSL